jgi:lipopolysaccharide/colanic/teichoic acid biosynthesis glycosyltransferase
MAGNEIRECMAARSLSAQMPWGWTLLDFYTSWKHTAWTPTADSAHLLKRAFDIVVSITALILLAPVFTAIAIAVKLDGGPVFFRQMRYGLHGREFGMLKFRSMCVDAEEKLNDLLAQNEKKEGITFKMKDDPRITKIGRIIRKSSLDELPQLWNVLKGEMSIVGPRPPVRREVEQYEQRHCRRFDVKPGITGLWQVGERGGGLFEIGDRSSIDFEEQVDLDVRYIESQSFWKDLWLLVKTVPVIIFCIGS